MMNSLRDRCIDLTLRGEARAKIHITASMQKARSIQAPDHAETSLLLHTIFFGDQNDLRASPPGGGGPSTFGQHFTIYRWHFCWGNPQKLGGAMQGLLRSAD